jgi:hypothetical protein
MECRATKIIELKSIPIYLRANLTAQKPVTMLSRLKNQTHKDTKQGKLMSTDLAMIVI